MTLELIIAIVALLAGALALVAARRVARRLDRMTESYWDLRYEQGQLRARVTRIEGRGEPDAPPASPGTGPESFIPLSSVKR